MSLLHQIELLSEKLDHAKVLLERINGVSDTAKEMCCDGLDTYLHFINRKIRAIDQEVNDRMKKKVS